MKNFFYLQRGDRHALLAVLGVVAVAAGVALLSERSGKTGLSGNADTTRTTASTTENTADTNPATTYYAAEGRKAELFTFDPNTADSTALLRLGLAPWQVRSIYKYRAAGGVYRKSSDFARLYGLTAGQYKALRPYIRISGDYRPAAEVYAESADNAAGRDTVRYPLKLKPGEHVALNTADTAALKRVPGIGSGLARAIAAYRERLGGYYSADQLLEIDNFPRSALPYFTVDPSRCRRLNANTLTLAQLRRHPYIGFYRAKTIIDHRRLHGPLRSVDDLRLYKDFTSETIERLSHYLDF